MLLKDYYPKLPKKFQKIKFNGIAFNSNQVKKNYIFFAIKGNNIDGNNYINHAITKGSNIIVSSSTIQGFSKNILYLKHDNPRRLLAEISVKINYLELIF